MREIKFKYYFENIRFGGICSIVYTLLDIENGSPVEDIDENVELRLIKRVQYTGLKDKNCVDIYDADIMMSENGNRIQVKIYEDYLGIQMINIDSESDDSKISEGTVIGNIYENPELLEAK